MVSTLLPAVSSRARATAAAACVALVLGACDAPFVDPLPAHVRRVERPLTLGVVDVPVVYGLVFDLYLPDPAACARVTADLTTRMRAAMLAPGRDGVELTAQTLSPGCSAPGLMPFDTPRFEAELASATQALGPHVRPFLVYFRNVSLPPPAELARSLEALRARGRPQPATFWGVTALVQHGLPLQLRAPWTHAEDPALLAPLETAAAEALPLSAVDAPSEHALLTDGERAEVLELKACSPETRRVQGVGFALGAAVPTTPEQPPRVRVTWDGEPQPHGTLTPPVLELTLELCTRDCHRTFAQRPDYVPQVWNATPGCVLLGDVP